MEKEEEKPEVEMLQQEEEKPMKLRLLETVGARYVMAEKYECRLVSVFLPPTSTQFDATYAFTKH